MPSGLDYTNLDNWAAHPDKIDESDRTPEGDIIKADTTKADVFLFILLLISETKDRISGMGR